MSCKLCNIFRKRCTINRSLQEKMFCRFVFSFWWSIFVCGIWWHLRQPLHVWKVDRHETKTIVFKKKISPLYLKNASIIKINSLQDKVELDLATNFSHFGNVSIFYAKMNVYENGFRDKKMEVYNINISGNTIESAYLDLLQDDIHLSPFRRIEIMPAIDWSFGSSEVPDFERAGHFKDGKWYEGRDSTQLGFGALFAWCMGVVFLVVMRRKSGTVVVKRKKRIFK